MIFPSFPSQIEVVKNDDSSSRETMKYLILLLFRFVPQITIFRLKKTKNCRIIFISTKYHYELYGYSVIVYGS